VRVKSWREKENGYERRNGQLLVESQHDSSKSLRKMERGALKAH
jgi:hypothetical protein